MIKCEYCNTLFDLGVTRYCPLCRKKPKGEARPPKKSTGFVAAPGRSSARDFNTIGKAPIYGKA